MLWLSSGKASAADMSLALVAIASGVATVSAASLDVSQTSSVMEVAKGLAAGAMSYYPGTATAFGDLPTPYYWWENGALMGAMLDYAHYTYDTTYNDILRTAISSQVVAPTYDLMVPAHQGDEGNDDQAFWAFAVLAAAERNFPQTSDTSIPSWLQVAENAFNSMSARWNTSACGGGLLWQIFPTNANGLNYRNSVSNGGLFQMGARLYRATGNQTYLDWANKVWEWTEAIGFIDSDYKVYDGADSRDNCTIDKRNNLTFSYSAGIYLHGAAVLANATQDSAWVTRTEGLLTGAQVFFGYNDNSTGVMYEQACEPYGTCTTDMLSFKGYLSRFMYSAALMVPSIADTVYSLMEASATAAGQACTGSTDSATCGQKWYTRAFDGYVGLGQQMSALETVHGLLAKYAPAPYAQGQIQDVRVGAAASTTPARGMVTSTLGTSTLGTSTLGTSTLGTSKLGTSTLGTSTLGTSTLGTSTLGTSTLGTSTLGTSPLGTSTLGTSTLGTSTSETSTLGTSTSETSTSETSTSENPTSENSASETSASETSASETSASDNSASETSASDNSASDNSASETSASETSASETSASLSTPSTVVSSVATSAPAQTKRARSLGVEEVPSFLWTSIVVPLVIVLVV